MSQSMPTLLTETHNVLRSPDELWIDLPPLEKKVKIVRVPDSNSARIDSGSLCKAFAVPENTASLIMGLPGQITGEEALRLAEDLSLGYSNSFAERFLRDWKGRDFWLAQTLDRFLEPPEPRDTRKIWYLGCLYANAKRYENGQATRMRRYAAAKMTQTHQNLSVSSDDRICARVLVHICQILWQQPPDEISKSLALDIVHGASPLDIMPPEQAQGIFSVIDVAMKEARQHPSSTKLLSITNAAAKGLDRKPYIDWLSQRGKKCR
jgi:hypothetical protein